MYDLYNVIYENVNALEFVSFYMSRSSLVCPYECYIGAAALNGLLLGFIFYFFFYITFNSFQM